MGLVRHSPIVSQRTFVLQVAMGFYPLSLTNSSHHVFLIHFLMILFGDFLIRQCSLLADFRAVLRPCCNLQMSHSNKEPGQAQGLWVSYTLVVWDIAFVICCLQSRLQILCISRFSKTARNILFHCSPLSYQDMDIGRQHLPPTSSNPILFPQNSLFSFPVWIIQVRTFFFLFFLCMCLLGLSILHICIVFQIYCNPHWVLF